MKTEDFTYQNFFQKYAFTGHLRPTAERLGQIAQEKVVFILIVKATSGLTYLQVDKHHHTQKKSNKVI